MIRHGDTTANLLQKHSNTDVADKAAPTLPGARWSALFTS